MHRHVAEERERAEPGPDGDVAAQESGLRTCGPLLLPADHIEEPDERQAGRQHHRRHHRLPGDEEDEEGGPQRRAALDQRVVMERAGRSGHLCGHGHSPRGRDGHENGAWGTTACALERGSDRAHAACSIFHSDWIAFRPSYSQLMPYCGRLTRLTLALAMKAGEPGTVEKTEFWSVVTVPSGPR